MSYSTGVQHNVNSPLFHEVFTVRIPENKLPSKTLQVHVWSVTEDGDEECLVSVVKLLGPRGGDSGAAEMRHIVVIIIVCRQIHFP